MTRSKLQIFKYLDEEFSVKIKKVEVLGNGIVYSHILFFIDNSFPIDRIYRILQINQKNADPSQILQEIYTKSIPQHMIDEILNVCQSFLNGRVPFDAVKIGKCSYFENLEFIRFCLDEHEKTRKTKKIKKISISLPESRHNSAITNPSVQVDTTVCTTRKLSVKQKLSSSLPNTPLDSHTNFSREQMSDLSASVKRPRKSVPHINHEELNKENEKQRKSFQLNLASQENLAKENENQNKPSKLELKLAQYEKLIGDLEKERDFYYHKLLKIEKLVKYKRGIAEIEKVLFEDDC